MHRAHKGRQRLARRNSEAAAWISSRYNFLVPLPEAALLYSARTGALLCLSGRDAREIAARLCGPPRPIDLRSSSGSLRRDLIEGGFVVLSHVDELSEVRARYWAARRETPLALTITTTMDCNLGCYYCYEARSNDVLSAADVPEIVRLAEERLTSSGKRALHVDWYGGEPLINLAFLQSASEALQALCRRLEVAYAASIISNGTCWPDDVEEFVAKHRIGQVQVSFDGLCENHNRRRHYRPGYKDGSLPSPFDAAVQLVDRLVRCVHVDVRVNIDRGNEDDVAPLIEMFRTRGWFGGPFPVTVQPARLAAYSQRSGFMREVQLDAAQFDAIRERVRQCTGVEVNVEESEAPDGYPHPRSGVCAALADSSIVVGADRRLYRCGLQVSEPSRAIGRLQGASAECSALPIIDAAEAGLAHDAQWWERFDPTEQPTCSGCSFLPICWGGCPKKHLERDAQALAEQGAYWRANLPRLIAERVGHRSPKGFAYSEADQFRD